MIGPRTCPAVSFIHFSPLFMLSDLWVKAQGGNYHTSAEPLHHEFVEIYLLK